MGFWDGVTARAVKEAGSFGFRQFKVGESEAYVKHAEERVSESGNPMLVITFANTEGAEIKHYIVDGEYKLGKLNEFYAAFGIPWGDSRIEEWRGKRGIVVCKEGKPNSRGNVYNQVSGLRPLAKPQSGGGARSPQGDRKAGAQTQAQSAAHSYDAKSFAEFKAFVKRDLGAGAQRYRSLYDDEGGKLEEPAVKWRLKSWADYTKKKRRRTIDNLIAEMFQAGVDSKQFYEILDGMEEKQARRRKEGES